MSGASHACGALFLITTEGQSCRKHSKKCTLYAVGFDCSFALAIT